MQQPRHFVAKRCKAPIHGALRGFTTERNSQNQEGDTGFKIVANRIKIVAGATKSMKGPKTGALKLKNYF
ncbi:hypothetical protein WCX49_08220 [Sulfurimonas sp. HSL-1656]|uniref:hypothetical protein n=1 Tax=Thiomicrolovo subterrani TaxID=3131934 RepID=UPI0031F85EF0